MAVDVDDARTFAVNLDPSSLCGSALRKRAVTRSAAKTIGPCGSAELEK
jgi:hypothetical protein